MSGRSKRQNPEYAEPVARKGTIPFRIERANRLKFFLERTLLADQSDPTDKKAMRWVLVPSHRDDLRTWKAVFTGARFTLKVFWRPGTPRKRTFSYAIFTVPTGVRSRITTDYDTRKIADDRGAYEAIQALANHLIAREIKRIAEQKHATSMTNGIRVALSAS